MGSWLLVLLIPGSTHILRSSHAPEADCIKVGFAVEYNVQDPQKPRVKPGSTFECVQTY